MGLNCTRPNKEDYADSRLYKKRPKKQKQSGQVPKSSVTVKDVTKQDDTAPNKEGNNLSVAILEESLVTERPHASSAPSSPLCGNGASPSKPPRLRSCYGDIDFANLKFRYPDTQAGVRQSTTAESRHTSIRLRQGTRRNYAQSCRSRYFSKIDYTQLSVMADPLNNDQGTTSSKHRLMYPISDIASALSTCLSPFLSVILTTFSNSGHVQNTESLHDYILNFLSGEVDWNIENLTLLCNIIRREDCSRLNTSATCAVIMCVYYIIHALKDMRPRARSSVTMMSQVDNIFHDQTTAELQYGIEVLIQTSTHESKLVSLMSDDAEVPASLHTGLPVLSLDVSGIGISSKFCAMLSTLNTEYDCIAELIVSNNELVREDFERLRSIANSKKLLVLNASLNTLTNDCIEDLVITLNLCSTSLVVLNISGCDISSLSINQLIRDGVSNLQCLETLDMSFNDLSRLDNQTVESLAQLHLKDLQLRSCLIGRMTIFQMCFALAGMSDLEQLDISGNQIADDVSSLCSLVQNKTRLRELYCENCSLSGKHIGMLCDTLSQHGRVIQRIDLSENIVDNLSLTPLLGMIRTCVNLIELSLNSCQIADAIFCHIADEFLNKQISATEDMRHLKVCSNNIGSDTSHESIAAVNEVIRRLSANAGIQCSLWGNPIYDSQK